MSVIPSKYIYIQYFGNATQARVVFFYNKRDVEQCRYLDLLGKVKTGFAKWCLAFFVLRDISWLPWLICDFINN